MDTSELINMHTAVNVALQRIHTAWIDAFLSNPVQAKECQRLKHLAHDAEDYRAWAGGIWFIAQDGDHCVAAFASREKLSAAGYFTRRSR